MIDIAEATKQNDTFRTALWTGDHLQLTLMSIRPGGEIGLEIHPNTDQFLRIEKGRDLSEWEEEGIGWNFRKGYMMILQ